MDVVTAARTSPPPVTPPATPPFTRYTRPSAYESTRIGFVVYSYTAVVSFDLTTYGNKQMMIEHIWRLDYMSSSTNTASGLLVITSQVITSEGQTSRTIVCACSVRREPITQAHRYCPVNARSRYQCNIAISYILF